MADRNHVHHRLIDIGLSHMQATLLLTGLNVLFVVLSFQLQHIGSLELMIVLLGLAQSLNTGLWLYDMHLRKKARKALDLPTIAQLRKAEYEDTPARKSFVEELLNN